MKKVRFYIFCNIVLFLLLTIICFQVLSLWGRYESVVKDKVFVQDIDGVLFKVIKGKDEGAVLIVGDILGTNFLSAKNLEKKDPLDHIASDQVIIVRLKNNPIKEMTGEELINMISNENGVVLADNFCIKGWERLREKDLYKKTSVSPGPYCLSEPQTILVDELVKSYHVKSAVLYYDTPGYLKMIDTFLKYLSERGIPYKLVKSFE